MRRAAALIWLLLVLGMSAHLSQRASEGLRLGFDLMALLPHEEQDGAIRRANEQVAKELSLRALLLIGHDERAVARTAAKRITEAITRSGLAQDAAIGPDNKAVRQLGRLYYPYRSNFLAKADRELLLQGRGEDIAKRALGQVFGFVGFGDAKLLRGDPFLLLPAFLADLPSPSSRLVADDGMLSVRDGQKTWALVAVRLNGEPYSLDLQSRFTELIDTTLSKLKKREPNLKNLRLGAIFYAHAGAQSAIRETSRIGGVSVIGVVILILFVFRGVGPLWQTLLAIGVGFLTALSASLLLFGELHIAALLFGASLIGTTVDYCLHYFCEDFAGDNSDSWARLRQVLPGLSLGISTTLIGYTTMFLAPLPGLHQIAVFSAIGMLASFTTVVLWLPYLDHGKSSARASGLTTMAGHIWTFWEAPRFRWWRRLLLLLLVISGALGLGRISVSDDIRRMQSLSPELKREQSEFRRMTSVATVLQYFLVRATNDETALIREEALMERLERLREQGQLAGYQAPAQFVPSAARQRENAALIAEHLKGPLLATHLGKLGLPAPNSPPSLKQEVLTLEAAQAALPLLRALILPVEDGNVTHVVSLSGPRRLDLLRQSADGLEGVRFTDPPADISRLLAQYRLRAVLLIALSIALMMPLLIWRYGLHGGALVILPPIVSIVLAPGLIALGGGVFTFFDAMALVLVLAIGVDYTVFLAEASDVRKPITMLAVSLATVTTMLAFGLLALSEVFAIHAFGSTMLLGIGLAFLLAPIAGRAGKRSNHSL